jgi:DNA primase
VDFKALRAQLRFADVLAHYGVQLRIKGDRATGFCPLPSHDVGRTPGRKRSPSFSADLAHGIWQCFGCQAKGNVLDFATHMEGLNPHDGSDLRKVALMLQREFVHDANDGNGKHRKTPPRLSRAVANTAVDREIADATPKPEVKGGAVTDDERPVLVNRPLDFALKDLDADHEYLRSRGFTRETIEHFGLGFCSRGLLKGRIAIPIRDGRGDLVAYAGRITDDDLIGEDRPKYLFPGPRDRKEARYEFHKSLVVYNLHAINEPVRDLIVVEGFASVWWLWQHGYSDVVALMGSSCSDDQADGLKKRVSPGGRIWAMSDGDDAGERCAAGLFLKCGNRQSVRYVRLRPGEQPTDCGGEELVALLPPVSAEKSGTSTQPAVANPAKNSNDRAGESTAAFK